MFVSIHNVVSSLLSIRHFDHWLTMATILFRNFFVLLLFDIFFVCILYIIVCRIVGSDDSRILKIVSGYALQAFVDSNNNLSVICVRFLFVLSVRQVWSRLQWMWLMCLIHPGTNSDLISAFSGQNSRFSWFSVLKRKMSNSDYCPYTPHNKRAKKVFQGF